MLFLLLWRDLSTSTSLCFQHELYPTFFISFTRGLQWRERHRKTWFRSVLLHPMLSNANLNKRHCLLLLLLPSRTGVNRITIRMAIHLKVTLEDIVRITSTRICCLPLRIVISIAFVSRNRRSFHSNCVTKRVPLKELQEFNYELFYFKLLLFST